MADLTDLGVAAIRDGVRGGAFSAREVAEAFNANVAKGKALNAYIIDTPEHALKAADQADRDRAEGKLKPLSGVPLGIKDLFATEGVQTTDTGGSIRQPAAFVGITGVKPTYGRCSRYGMVAFASSLDQAGPMARDVRDCAIMLEVMAGHDPKDSTSLKLDVPAWEANLSSDIRGKRIGIPKEYRIDGVPEEIDRVWEQGISWMRDAGAEIVEVSLPHTRHALPTYYIIAPAEASSNLARYDGVKYGKRVAPDNGNLIDMYQATRAAGFGAEVKRRIMIGTYVLSAGFYDAYFNQAQKVRALIARDFEAVWNDCDLLLTPTAPSAAFALGEKTADPIAMYLNDVFAVPASLAGLPAMSVPAALNDQGLPLGLQIIGKAFDEQTVLNAGLAFEERAGFTARAEAWW